MSYTLTPIVVDLTRVRSLMGSKDTAFLQALIKKERKKLLDIDGGGEDYEDFEDEIKAEYKAFATGDFSSVNLEAVYDDEEKEEDDEELSEMVRDLKGKDLDDPEVARKFNERLGSLVTDIFDNMHLFHADQEKDKENRKKEKEEAGDEVREVSAGVALVHMIMGGNQDPSVGYKYGYAFEVLCQHLGEVLDHDSWCTIRNAAFDAVDAALKKMGIKPAVFSTSKFLLERGAPVAIPESVDFPFIGYVERKEAKQALELLDPAKVEAAIRDDKENAEWLRDSLTELRSWLETCVKQDRDLVCFYT